MESIGDKLKGQRESKGFSVEQVARDTNIAKRYLEALEAEDFSVFPGDPYLIGFLRNYADYLGIDPDEMITLYRNFQIQSQPVPMNELLEKKDRKPLLLGLAAVVVVAALVVAGYYLIPKVLSARSARIAARAEQEESDAVEPGLVYELEDEILERRFQEKDIIAITFKDERYEITLTHIGNELTLTVPGGTNVLRIGDERAIDLDGDAKMDIKVALNDIDSAAKIKTAVLRLDRFVKETVEIAEETPRSPEIVVAEVGISEVGRPELASRKVEDVLIRQAEKIEPFSINIIFRGYCLFRYLVDGRDREERYFHKGDTIILDVTRDVGLWISNAGSMIAKVDGVEVDFGRPGEVSTRLVGWVTDEETGQNSLLMQAVY